MSNIVSFYEADRSRNHGRFGHGLDGPNASGPNPNRTIKSGTEPESGPQGLRPKLPEGKNLEKMTYQWIMSYKALLVYVNSSFEC